LARTTTTRAALRRAICRKLQMDFYDRYDSYSSMTGSPSTTAITDGSLVQDADYWNAGWVYIASGSASGDVRLVLDFGGGTITPERALSGSPAVGDTYEILQRYSPYQIHAAINEAIIASDTSFFQIITDETLVLEEDKLEYSLTSLGTAPWIILKIFLERNTGVVRGTATSGGAATLTHSGQDFSSVTTNYRLSIYDGTGKGQIRTVSSGTSGGVITVSANWTTQPDSTSKYTLWDTSEQEIDWYRLPAARFDDKEYPTKLYLTRNYSSLNGLRIRLVYAAIPAELSTDAATTVVPKEYVINKALSILYAASAGDNRKDRQKHMTLSAMLDERAEQYKRTNASMIPDVTLWEARDTVFSGGSADTEDPLGWDS